MLIQFDPEILLQGMYATNELTKAYQNHNIQTHTHIDLSVTTLVIAEKKKREKLETAKELINTRSILQLYEMEKEERNSFVIYYYLELSSWLSGKESTCQAGDFVFNPWVESRSSILA